MLLGAAGMLASCTGAPAAVPVAPPGRCPDTATSATPAPSTNAAPTAAVSAAPSALPTAPAFDLKAIGSPEKLQLRKLAAKGAGQSSYAVVPRANGGAWLVPGSVRRKQALFLVDAGGAASEPWSSPVEARLEAARDTADGAWLLGVPAQPGVFTFPHVERLFRLSASGRVAFDHAFTAGLVRPRGAGSDAAGNLLVLGTLAGPLAGARGTLTPEAGGRAEVLFKIVRDESKSAADGSKSAAAGSVEWATALERTSGQASTLAVAPDGSSVVAASPFLGEQVLAAFSPEGRPTWTKALTSIPPASFPSPWVESMASDGKGGVFATGHLNESGGFDFGLGALTGQGSFVTLLDGSGRAAWEKSLPDAYRITGDGAGSALIFRTADEGLVAYEIDGAGRVARAIGSDLPQDCRSVRSEITAAAALTATHVFFAVTCQPLDDRYMPPAPLGKPSIHTGSVARR